MSKQRSQVREGGGFVRLRRIAFSLAWLAALAAALGASWRPFN